MFINQASQPDSSGNVGIGTTSVPEKLWGGDVAPDVDKLYTISTGSKRWKEIYAFNGVINTSDIREKRDVVPLSKGLQQIMQLNPVTFYWKGGGGDREKHIGLVAQEVQVVLPEVVKEGGGRLGINYSELVPVLIKGMQELRVMNYELLVMSEEKDKRIEKLEREIKDSYGMTKKLEREIKDSYGMTKKLEREMEEIKRVVLGRQ